MDENILFRFVFRFSVKLLAVIFESLFKVEITVDLYVSIKYLFASITKLA